MNTFETFGTILIQVNIPLSEFCKVKDRKTGEQVLFVAVPNRETNILAYSDSAHKSQTKTVTFGKFRIFCFVESENSPYTDLLADSEKIHLEKTKRKVCTL